MTWRGMTWHDLAWHGTCMRGRRSRLHRGAPTCARAGPFGECPDTRLDATPGGARALRAARGRVDGRVGRRHVRHARLQVHGRPGARDQPAGLDLHTHTHAKHVHAHLSWRGADARRRCLIGSCHRSQARLSARLSRHLISSAPEPALDLKRT
eukprot:350372-Chlamydomonas_euryale.AAC.11